MSLSSCLRPHSSHSLPAGGRSEQSERYAIGGEDVESEKRAERATRTGLHCPCRSVTLTISALFIPVPRRRRPGGCRARVETGYEVSVETPNEVTVGNEM